LWYGSDHEQCRTGEHFFSTDTLDLESGPSFVVTGSKRFFFLGHPRYIDIFCA
jgi:hypothetical protein